MAKADTIPPAAVVPPPEDTMLSVRARQADAAVVNESADPRDAGSNAALAREQAKAE